MKPFEGFPIRMEFTPIPRVFIQQVLPVIDDADQIKILLAAFNLIYQKKGNLRYAGLNEWRKPAALMGLSRGDDASSDGLKKLLSDAVDRSILLAVDITGSYTSDTLYFVNGPAERDIVEQIRSGKITIEGSVPEDILVSGTTLPDVFSLYENNIGQLTPMIADELKDALNTYREEWIREAIREAVNLNKRNWRYISRILERWVTEGKKDGTYSRHSQATDPDKFIKGKYGHLVQR